MASEEETRKNGDLRKVANVMHACVSEFFHFVEKPLPAAAGSVFYRGQRAARRAKKRHNEIRASAGNLMKSIKSRKCAPRLSRKHDFENCIFEPRSGGDKFCDPNYSQ